MIGPTSSSTDSSSALSSVTGAAGSETVSVDQFLTLLVAQLTHQDPLNPTEGTEFTAQLAQFSSLEQLVSINQNLGKLENLETSLVQSQAVGMIGKEILAEGNTIAITDGISSNVIFSLEKGTNSASISVFNQEGELVSVVESTDPLQSGQNTIAFAAFDGNQDPLPDGIYTFNVLALDEEGKAINVETFSSGIVSGVGIAEDGTTNLKIGTTDFPLSSVVQVVEPKVAEPESTP